MAIYRLADNSRRATGSTTRSEFERDDPFVAIRTVATGVAAQVPDSHAEREIQPRRVRAQLAAAAVALASIARTLARRDHCIHAHLTFGN
jgi:hypothetical protein